MHRTAIVIGLVSALGLAACALDTEGTGSLISDAGSGGTESGGTSTGGVIVTAGATTGGFSTGGGDPGGGTGGGSTGGTATGGTGGGTCGNGLIEAGETCDPGTSGSVSGCAGCTLDAAFVATIDEGTLTDADGRVHYYFTNPTDLGFEQAEATCATLGAHLVAIQSAAEQAEVAAVGASLVEYWIGGRDPQNVASALTWVGDEADAGYQPAAGIELNGFTEYCVIIKVQADAATDAHGWHDRACASAYPSVCEWIVPGTPG